MSNNRIAILIDGNNFYKGCQLNFHRTDVDFRKLGEKLCWVMNGELLRTYYYNAHVSKTIDPTVVRARHTRNEIRGLSRACNPCGEASRRGVRQRRGK